MGCDIHLFVEKRSKYEDSWSSLDVWKQEEDSTDIESIEEYYTHGRNYNLFCALAGVRINSFTNEPKFISEPKGLPKDCSSLIKLNSDSWGSDGHSHSYLTLEELESFDWSEYGETCNEFLKEVLPKLKDALEDKQTSKDIRIVFWFDN